MTKKTKELSVQDLIDLEDVEDQSQETGGDFERSIPAEGETMARFVEYIELGLQPQRPYMGQPKDPAEEVQLVFELLSPDNIREVEVNGETKVFTDKIYLTVTKKLSGRAKFKKIFEAMRYGRDNIKHMKKMLGEAFILDIKHNVVTNPTTKKSRTYVNIGSKDSVGIRGPFTTNLKTRKQVKEDVPEATVPLKIFLQDHPTKESWDSLFIDGEYEKDGVKKSKNFIQNKILSSPSFEGSPLQNLLEGLGELTLTEDTSEEEPEEKVTKLPAKKTGSIKAKAAPKKVATKAKTKQSSKDAFKALGLDIK